jgi:hypothetical protein
MHIVGSLRDFVVHLDLPEAYMVEFPGEFLQLTQLKALNLSKNNIGSIPRAIYKLTSLESDPEFVWQLANSSHGFFPGAGRILLR